MTGETAVIRHRPAEEQLRSRPPGSGARSRSSPATRELTVDDAAFTAGLAAASASRDAKSFTIGANWYPAAYIKYYATYERTTFDGGAARADRERHPVP